MNPITRFEKYPSALELSRFHGYYEIVDSGCWEWLAYKDSKGYGQFKSMGKSWRAHRFSYLLANNKTSDQTLDHLCNNTSCVNPEHLREASLSSNRLRAAGSTETHFSCGHLRTEYMRNGKYIRCKPCRKSYEKLRYKRSRIAPHR